MPKKKKYIKGGKLKGPSHEKGGIPIEVEGGEYIIKKDSVNDETLPILIEINEKKIALCSHIVDMYN